MKIQPARADGFARKPDAAVRAVLLYGPDSGLVRERAEALIKAVAGGLDDPFRTREISAAELKEDPALLRDEANALSLMGGRRAIRLRSAVDSQAKLFEELLDDEVKADSLIVIEAGLLSPSSKLRGLFEDHPAAAAIACYLDDDSTLADVIRDSLRQAKLDVAPDALDFLVGRLGGDRMLTRREIEKLILYCTVENQERGRVTLADAEACVGDSSEQGVDDIAAAVARGDLAELDHTFERVTREGTHSIAILRAVSRHFERLHFVAGKMAEGANADSAIKALRPPLFFKAVMPFKAALRQWPAANIGRALDMLLKAEMDCKTTGMPADAITARVLMQLATAARRAASSR
ncbi:MAG TPA: DNA polymerase III subunit delta [Alphaproteobacteria bacterium]|jgi:DNA polymerase-3 subunit delta